MTTIGPVPASSTGRFRSTIRPGTVPIQQARHVSALEILANRFQLVSRLADDLAHEIKNPLHAMVINLELVKRRAQAGDVSTVLERADLASAEVMRVNALLDQLLQLLRPARQGDRVLDLDAAVGEVLPLLAHQARLSKVVELETMALANRPELVVLNAAIRQEETRAQLAEKSFSPDYTLSGGYMVMPDGSRYRNTYAAELAVTLPWLNRGRHDAEIAEATAAVAARQADYESRRVAIFAEIQESLVGARAAQRLVQLYGDTLRPQAQAVLKATVAAYQTDRTDFLNLLDSQNTTLDVELDYIKAVSELETHLADLERAVGTRLPRAGNGLPSRSIDFTPSVLPTQEVLQ